MVWRRSHFYWGAGGREIDLAQAALNPGDPPLIHPYAVDLEGTPIAGLTRVTPPLGREGGGIHLKRPPLGPWVQLHDSTGSPLAMARPLAIPASHVPAFAIALEFLLNQGINRGLGSSFLL